MKYVDLLEIDKFGAFNDFIPMSTAFEMLMPDYYRSVFSETCKCGSEVIISKSLTRFLCCNPRCPIKMAETLGYVFKGFSCKNVGIKTCEYLVRMYLEGRDNLKRKGEEVSDTFSHLEVLNIPDEWIPEMGQSQYLHFRAGVEKIKTTPVTFPSLVGSIGIPGFDTITSKVFEDIGNASALADKMESAGGIKPFLESRGVYDPMKVFYLQQFLYDIVYAQSFVFKHMMPIGKVKLEVVVTGRLRTDKGPITEEAFIQLCNMIGVKNGVRVFDIESTSKISTTQFVISDYESTSSKRLKAEERESLEGDWGHDENGNYVLLKKRKLIYTAQEFLDYLKGVVECAEQQMNLF